MERLNKKTLSFPAITRAIAMLGFIFAVAACGDKGGSNAPPPIYPNGCMPTCANINQPLTLTTFQAGTPDGTMVLTSIQLIGNASNVQQNGSGSLYNWYAGPIVMQGTMTISRSMQDSGWQGSSQCFLSAGTYNIQTTTPGQMNLYGGDIVMSSMIATGPSGTLELRVEAPLNTMTGGQLNSNGQRLYANIRVARVNGITCSQGFFGTVN